MKYHVSGNCFNYGQHFYICFDCLEELENWIKQESSDYDNISIVHGELLTFEITIEWKNNG